MRKGTDQNDTPIDIDALKHLHSLGYVAEGSVKKDFSFDQSKDDPKDLIGYHNDGREISQLVQQNKFVEARVLIERLIKQRPVYGIYELGTHVALKQEDYKAAVRYGEKALELEKSSSFNFYVSFHFNLALAYTHTQQDEAAARQLELILEFTKNDPVAFRARRVQVHNHLGGLRYRQKKFDQAILQLKESLKLDPDQHRILHTLAKTLLTCPNEALRNPSKAVELAEKACKLTQSKDAMYLNTLSVAYFTTKNYSEAAKTCEKALALVQSQGDQARAAKLQEELNLIKKAWMNEPN